MILTSCEDVIELDLENAAPKLVIDATVDATAGTTQVILTMSNGFYDDINLDFVNDATVNLTLADGSIVNLPMIQDGLYGAFGLNISEGDELTMTVIDGTGNEYKATEKVPYAVAIDSLEIIPTNSAGPNGGSPFGGGGQFYQVFTHWQDDANQENFYRIRAIVNDTLQTNLITMIDDINLNGEAISRPVFQSFEAGDTVTIQLLSMDEGSYLYFSDLTEIIGQGLNNSTTPFNATSNFDNDVLGYFSIFRKDEETIILPE